ncbi:hypothetical protein ABEB36_001706 [Hypothenemus hampei]|uniref:Glutamyl-tRNA(Gln) amidotransferase subunit B, mitochondrial n=1 Tax=Hypothenemus hampei TaxID=57062 RepID=A0ABD1FFH7_HYPHA
MALSLKRLLLNDQKLLVKRYSQATKNNKKWKSVVGLEVHAQIASKSKLFSGAPTKFSNPVNTNVSLFDMATPGTLPVLNKRCVEAGVLTALALNCQVNPVSYFDRKHYFYADLPAGYQITQQRLPLAVNGALEFHVFTPEIHKKPYKTSARIKQLQLEQDSGKSLHDFDRSLVDLNRAGISLMELVFEPDLSDGEEAAALIKELIAIFQRIETCSCKMEEGALRVDANVSIHKENEPLGIRTEIKNIGSVRGVVGAVNYEIKRQIAIKESNGVVVNETRAWNFEKKITVPMRDKEILQDYRYMPEPNLPPLQVSMGPITGGQVYVDQIKENIPELPEKCRQRLQTDMGLSTEQSIIIVNDVDLMKLFENALYARSINPVKFANFLINDLYKALNERKLEIHQLHIEPKYFGEILELVSQGLITRNVASMVLNELLQGNIRSPLEIVEEKNWKQITDEKELEKICQAILQENPKGVTQYLNGKVKVFKAFLGGVANKTDNRADMKKVETILKKILSELRNKK